MRIIHELDTTYKECRNRHLSFDQIQDPWVVYHGTGSVFEKDIEDRDLCAAVRRRLAENRRAGGVTGDPDEVLASVHSLLAEMAPLRTKLESFVANHQYGVVYAVQLLWEEHLPFLVPDGTTDLRCRISRIRIGSSVRHEFTTSDRRTRLRVLGA